MYTSDPFRVRSVAPPDRERLVRVLTRAFDSDPLTCWFVLDDRRRAERLRRLFDWYLEQCLPLGLSHTTTDLSGTALWMGPGQWSLPLLRQLTLLPDILRVVGLRRALSRIVGVDSLQREHPSAPHYYLAALGVEPAAQRRGIGSTLLAEGLRRCDAARMPAYLETANERTIPLYERHGFRIRADVVIRGAGPEAWLMWRAPRDAVTPA